MARSHLTLAALATAAVDGLDVRQVGNYDTGDSGDFDSAIITGADGRHFVVRVPTTERAENEQSADIQSLSALSTGVRGRLPFDVSKIAGQTAVDSTRAVVFEHVYGDPVHLASIPAGEGLATSIGRAIAAIHMLPTSFVADAGLPVRAPHEVLRAVTILMDRASATSLVPASLLGRWERATEDTALWQFVPTVVNGSISTSSLRQTDGEVCGVLGWQSLAVDDPAQDLFWAMGAPDAVAQSIVDSYQLARGSSDRQIVQRARLYAELQLAKWLLHGTQTRDNEVIDDAVSMLHNLVDRVEHNIDKNITHDTIPVMAVDEVEAMLDARDRRSDNTA